MLVCVEFSRMRLLSLDDRGYICYNIVKKVHSQISHATYISYHDTIANTLIALNFNQNLTTLCWECKKKVLLYIVSPSLVISYWSTFILNQRLDSIQHLCSYQKQYKDLYLKWKLIISDILCWEFRLTVFSYPPYLAVVTTDPEGVNMSSDWSAKH